MSQRFRLSLVREPAAAPAGKQVHGPKDMTDAVREILRDELQECFVVVLLDQRHRVRGWVEVARGGMTECPVDFKILFGAVLTAGVPAFAVAHNHPSGETSPSPQDHALTRRIARAAELLDLRFVDHLIVGEGEVRSLQADGLL